MRNKLNRLISVILTLTIMVASIVSLSITVGAQQVSDDNDIQDVANIDEVDTDEIFTDVDSDSAAKEQQIEVTNADGEQPKDADIATTAQVASLSDTGADNAPSVPKVGTIYKDSKSTNQIHIYWKAVSNIDGYYVYMRNSDTSKDFSLLTTTTDTELYIKNLPDTTPYQFKVSAFKVVDGEVFEGEYSYLETATEPDSIPAMSLKKSSTVIGFSWKKVANADGYIVYRACTKSGAKFVKYKTIKGSSTTSFEDKSIEKGKSYFYQVKAYRTPYTGRTYYGTGTTLKAVAGLAAPTAGNCTTQLRRVSLVWNKQSVAQGYFIYYSTSKDGPFKHLKTTTKTFYNSPRLTENKTYYFRVVPYRVNGKHTITGTWMSVTKKISSKAFNKTIGNTYIEVSLKQQHMWMYINGNLYCETDVVTGNDDGYHGTPRGAFSVWQRSSPSYLSGPGWGVSVNYWLAFTYSGCGIHDSTWRSSKEYGGSTYKGNGSHGCVNTPYSKVKQIYQKAKIGTPVVVY